MEPDFIPMIPKKGLIKHRQIEPYDLYEYWSITNGGGSGSGSGDGDFMVGKHGVVDYRDSETVEWEITEESGDEGSIIVIRANAAAQVQSDWEQSDSGEPDYIKNKPEIPEQVQSDWEQSDTGEADYIKNKPELGDNYEYWKLKGPTGGKTSIYGVMYNGYVIADLRGISPDGWHVPTKTEYETLIATLGGGSIAGKHLKEDSDFYWEPDDISDNSSGFTARGGSVRLGDTGVFGELMVTVRYWTSTEYDSYNYYILYLEESSDAASMLYTYSGWKKMGNYVRLIKDDSTDPGTMSDFDGNVYATVKIGDQVWMAADLITEHYNNGDEIPNIMEASEWIALVTGGFCYYNNTRGNAYSEMTAGDILVHSHDLVRFKDTDTIRWRINEISATEIEVIADGSILEDDVVALQMQSDWNQSNTESADYIKNKPEIPEIPENIISGVTDGVWDLDMTAGNLKVSPYAARTSGGFDSGSVHPNEYTRLNWNGMFFARTLQSNNINYLSRGVLVIGGNGTVDYPALVSTTWDTNVEIYCYKNGSTHGGWGWQTVPIYIGCVNAHSSVFNNAEWIKIDDEQQLFEVFMTHIKFSKGLPVYDDNASAVTAGLATNSLYRKTTGEVMIVY